MNDCLFCRIAAGEIPATVLYEDDQHIAFRDINPAAPVHAIVIPKAHYGTLLDVPDAGVHGALLEAACAAARALGLEQGGFRLVANFGGDGGQEVMHVHWHLLGGRLLGWPPG
ncbi:MAG: HIT domain-containing protein [Chthonomonadales bacterium]|nr:HIT domain-containing protein [Chthonomonadales bacterium]